MGNANMGKIAIELWTSKYDVNENLMCTSSAHKLLIYDVNIRSYDILKDFIFYNFEQRKLENCGHHMFQFEVWMKSMNAKYASKSFFLLVLSVLFQIYMLLSIDNANEAMMYYSNNNIDSDTSTSSLVYQEFENKAQSFYINMQITVYLSWVAITFPVEIILKRAFADNSGRNFQMFTFNNILDITIMTVFIIRLFNEYNDLNDGINKSDSFNVRSVKYFSNIFMNSENFNLVAYLYAIASFLLSVKVIIDLRMTRLLGPLIKIIKSMLYDISVFMTLFCIQLVAFSCIGTLLFIDTEAFSSFYQS
jgi:hypothetical protein